MIHPTAVIHPNARLDSTVTVGPYSVIDADVELGPECHVGPHVYLTGRTTIGAGNRFHAGAIIGDAPQDLKYDGAPTRLRIGDRNVFREHCTIHRATDEKDETVIGSDCLFMACSHVGHNSHVGDSVIMVNGSMLGGHAQIGDRAFLSGGVLIHQFVRIGTLAIAQGGAALSQDLPPFTIARNGLNMLCGLNSIGMRRAGLSNTERLELRQLYHVLFRSGTNQREFLEKARSQFTTARAHLVIDFVASSKRGVCSGESTTHPARDAGTPMVEGAPAALEGSHA